jgi:outer membrane protein assembly factor BamB
VIAVAVAAPSDEVENTPDHLAINIWCPLGGYERLLPKRLGRPRRPRRCRRRLLVHEAAPLGSDPWSGRFSSFVPNRLDRGAWPRRSTMQRFLRQWWRPAIASTAAVIALAACGWANDRFDPARTARNPQSGIGTSNAASIKRVWTSVGMADSQTPAFVSGGTAVLQYGDHARALDLTDGSVLWTTAAGGLRVGGISSGTVYAVRPSSSMHTNYTLVALDLDTGATQWSASRSPSVGETNVPVIAAVDGNTLLIDDEKGAPSGSTLDVWDVSTRKVRWSTAAPASSYAEAIAGGVVYRLAYHDGDTIDAVDEQDGQPIWSVPYHGPCPYGPTPVVSGPYLYAYGETRRISDGSVVHTWDFCPPQLTSVAVDGEIVFAYRAATSTSTATLYVFDGITGAFRWSARAEGVGAGPYGSPTIADDLVLLTDGNTVVARAEADGHRVGSFTLDGDARPVTDAVAASGTVLVAGSDDALYAARPGTQQLAVPSLASHHGRDALIIDTQPPPRGTGMTPEIGQHSPRSIAD